VGEIPHRTAADAAATIAHAAPRRAVAFWSGLSIAADSPVASPGDWALTHCPSPACLTETNR
jgi:hypothetical protein